MLREEFVNHSTAYRSPLPQVMRNEMPSDSSTEPVLLAVNGTLMRGLELNPNLLAVGASFVAEAWTSADYRLWSIEDRYPAMLRSPRGGAAIACELWAVPPAGLAQLLRREPPGLVIGKVRLSDGHEVLGILAEPFLCDHRLEITAFGGWREFMASKNAASR